MRLFALALCLATAAYVEGAEPSPVARAEALIAQINTERDTDERFRLADQAQALCEKAIQQKPSDPRPHLVLSRALTVTDLQHPEACRPGACQRAVDELKKARVLDGNGIEAEHIASELGIVLSRVGAFAEALAEYDRALRLVDSERRPNSLDDGGDRAVLYGNSAETLMALGRLGEAIERYRLAEAASSPGDVEWQLAEWGLGVALDRDEQVEKARAAVARALAYDATMNHLSEDGVFFEPAGDKLYYLALGYEVAEDRREAMEAWRQYLQVQPRSRFAHRARAHLDALKKGPRLQPEPPPEVSFGDPMVLQGGQRTPERILASLREHVGDVRLCYARSLRSSHHVIVGGVIKLSFEVIPAGYPMPHPRAIDTTAVDDNELVRCVESAAASWRFSPVDGQELEILVVPVQLGKQP